MPGGQYVALSGMRARLDHLDRLASDIANVGTAGYKTERQAMAQADRPTFDSALQSAVDVTSGARRVDLSSGSIAPTGRDLDFAIDGSGFFTVSSPAGIRYTRNGHFARQADGMLVTEDGATVMGSAGPLKMGPGSITVDADGTVRAGGVAAGRFALADFTDPAQLVSETGTRLRADGGTPQPATAAQVRAGALEQSNVSVAERVVELTQVSRTFEALQRAISLQMNDLDGRAIDILGRR